MSRHFLLIDPLARLDIKKDSSLLLALTLQQTGCEVYVFFESDFAFDNGCPLQVRATRFQGELAQDGIAIASFELVDQSPFELFASDLIHMRLDPPFDARYLRVLWLLMAWQKQAGVRVLNDPRGIAIHNEKLAAYGRKRSLASFAGASYSGFKTFIQRQKNLGVQEIVLKPLDLFQGQGVEKMVLDDKIFSAFERKVKECGGALVAQAFDSSVMNGEIRAIYFKAKELGSILKVPAAGKFLTNIAQGASFTRHQLSSSLQKECEEICHELALDGIDWIAFDILGENISEVNITCPGLLVEVSQAWGKNLALNLVNNGNI